MVQNSFYNFEEELQHCIRANGSAYEEYQEIISKIQNINYTDDNNYSFLHEAVVQRKFDIVKDLLWRGIDVNLQDVNGNTAAMLAASNNQWDILDEILNYPYDVNRREWRYGSSLLFEVMCKNGEQRNAMAIKLINMGANPYAKNYEGKSPLDLAILMKNNELTELFQQVKSPMDEVPEKFRIPMKTRGFFKLSFRDYEKYILVKDVDIPYIEDKIRDYSNICGGKKAIYKFRIISIKESLWTVIVCPQKMDFYNYHNMMSWIVGLKEKELIKKTICVVLNKEEERSSYYCIMDKEYSDSRLLGRFQNGESFSIYLPEAYKKDGNAQSFRDYLPISSIEEYLKFCGFEYGCIAKLVEMNGKEISVEMAIK